ncbi:MAG: DUF1801 domain-containing protein [Sphingobacteriaceae bacterium]|nr:MAG: DUF1801 domain-containing protein [Sphingobacteriaceae bacterium]
MESKAKTLAAGNVDEYLHALPEDVQIMLYELRKAIKTAAPMAEELMSYQVPTYKYKGALVHFAAFKNHCSLVVVNKQILSIFEKELMSFKTTGMTIHFTTDKPLPNDLVQKIVQVRVKQNEEADALKPKKR